MDAADLPAESKEATNWQESPPPPPVEKSPSSVGKIFVFLICRVTELFSAWASFLLLFKSSNKTVHLRESCASGSCLNVLVNQAKMVMGIVTHVLALLPTT